MSNTLTLTLSTDTRTALQAEADAEHLSLERHINRILARRFERPSWPDRAEAADLADQLEVVTGERDRARATAVLQEGHTRATRALVFSAIEAGQLVPSPAFRAAFDESDAVPGGDGS